MKDEEIEEFPIGEPVPDEVRAKWAEEDLARMEYEDELAALEDYDWEERARAEQEYWDSI